MGESSAADLGVTVADESGEMQGTLHRGVLNEHPAKVGVGAALALTQVWPCLLAPRLCTAAAPPPLHRAGGRPLALALVAPPDHPPGEHRAHRARRDGRPSEARGARRGTG